MPSSKIHLWPSSLSNIRPPHPTPDMSPPNPLTLDPAHTALCTRYVSHFSKTDFGVFSLHMDMTLTILQPWATHYLCHLWEVTHPYLHYFILGFSIMLSSILTYTFSRGPTLYSCTAPEYKITKKKKGFESLQIPCMTCYCWILRMRVMEMPTSETQVDERRSIE